MKFYQWLYKSKVGDLFLVASERGLSGLHWSRQGVPMLSSLKTSEPWALHIKKTLEQLDEYFKGERSNFDLEIDLEGTPFQMSVWNKLKDIPFGTTCSYKDIAQQIKNEKAVRAVGTANGRNPVCIIIPCHRVIENSGGLGGYAGGLKAKKQLLALESQSLRL